MRHHASNEGIPTKGVPLLVWLFGLLAIAALVLVVVGFVIAAP